MTILGWCSIIYWSVWFIEVCRVLTVFTRYPFERETIDYAIAMTFVTLLWPMRWTLIVCKRMAS